MVARRWSVVHYLRVRHLRVHWAEVVQPVAREDIVLLHASPDALHVDISADKLVDVLLVEVEDVLGLGHFSVDISVQSIA